MNNEIKFTLPPMAEGQTDWQLYTEYQSPVGRDPWPLGDRIMWRVLMWFHGLAEKLWHWIWDIAQPFKEPPMRYETKYREMKVLKQDGQNVTVDHPEYVANGQPIFPRVPVIGRDFPETTE